MGGLLESSNDARYWEVWMGFLNILDRVRDLSRYQISVY